MLPGCETDDPRSGLPRWKLAVKLGRHQSSAATYPIYWDNNHICWVQVGVWLRLSKKKRAVLSPSSQHASNGDHLTLQSSFRKASAVATDGIPVRGSDANNLGQSPGWSSMAGRLTSSSRRHLS